MRHLTGFFVWPAFFAALLAAFATAAAQAKKMPIFDAHIHYNKAAWVAFDPLYVREVLQRAGVVGGLVGSWPDEGTIRLHSAFPERFLAQLCPYTAIEDRRNWTRLPTIMRFFTERIATGRYKGLGELHILKQAEADWEIIGKTVALARAHNLFLHIHAGAAVIERLFAMAPDVRILWAHGGFSEKAARISGLLDTYPKLSVELSLRAPNIFPELSQEIGADWRALFERHQNRILLGSDTYINLAWATYDEIIGAHRRWLSRLPRDIAEKIAWRNAKTFFALPDTLFQSD